MGTSGEDEAEAEVEHLSGTREKIRKKFDLKERERKREREKMIDYGFNSCKMYVHTFVGK